MWDGSCLIRYISFNIFTWVVCLYHLHIVTELILHLIVDCILCHVNWMMHWCLWACKGIWLVIWEKAIFILGLATMVWHMFIVKKLSSAAFLMDKVMFWFYSAVSCRFHKLMSRVLFVSDTCTHCMRHACKHTVSLLYLSVFPLTTCSLRAQNTSVNHHFSSLPCSAMSLCLSFTCECPNTTAELLIMEPMPHYYFWRRSFW